jgi:hypothetical protein
MEAVHFSETSKQEKLSACCKKPKGQLLFAQQSLKKSEKLAEYVFVSVCVFVCVHA